MMTLTQVKYDCEDLISIFNQTFSTSLNTELVRGDDEPVYLPADAQFSRHRILFAHGFFNSALHEIAHWCIAGEERRKLVDYGYWYNPDGRDADQQQAFERVEIKPQAVEWGLAAACGKPFNVSTDNLNGVQPDRLTFQHKVYDQVLNYLQYGFPPRAARLMKALRDFYEQPPLNSGQFAYRGMYER